MLERKTVVDQIEVRRDDSLGVRLALLVVDGDKELSQRYHRVSIEPGQDATAVMDDINAHLASEGEMPLTAQDIERIARHATAAG